MKRFVVSHIDYFDHELTSQLVEAETWEKAVTKHPKCAELFSESDIEDFTLEQAQEYAFNQDAAINVLEIPEPK